MSMWMILRMPPLPHAQITVAWSITATENSGPEFSARRTGSSRPRARFIDMSWWDACVHPDATPLSKSNRTLHVWVGVDASVKRNSTAIVAVSWDKKYQHARLVWHRMYQPSAEDPMDFERVIEATLLDLNKRFRVRKVWYDPYQMHATAQRLTRAGLKLEEFPQTVPNLTEASQNLFELIKGSNLVAYPDACPSPRRQPRHRGGDGARLAHCQGQASPQDRRRDRSGDGRACRHPRSSRAVLQHRCDDLV